MGSYDPLYIWQKDAIKEAKASGMSVTKDKISGAYIVRDKNRYLDLKREGNMIVRH